MDDWQEVSGVLEPASMTGAFALALALALAFALCTCIGIGIGIWNLDLRWVDPR